MLWQRKRGWRFWLLGGLLLAGLIRLAAIQGLIVPVRIAGGSMAETLVGVHYRITCRDCGFAYRCDAEPPPESGQTVCPNCGYGQDLPAEVTPGQRVLIDRGAYWFWPPQRHDLVALRDPQQPARLAVKRLVGLPGEAVEIRRGDLLVNGVQQKKSLPQRRRDSVLIFDDGYRPQRAAVNRARWQPRKSPSGWRDVGDGYDFVAPGHASAGQQGSAEACDWLVYRHRAMFAGPLQGKPAAILDDVPYNQGVSRRLHSITDVMLACRIQSGRRGGIVQFRIRNGNSLVAAAIDFRDGRGRLQPSGRPATATRLREIAQDQSLSIEYSVYDGVALLAIDGQFVLQCDCERPDRTPSVELSIGASKDNVSVRELRVYRDRYYLPGAVAAREAAGVQRAEASGWFLLGDNPAISVDSRHWSPGVMPSRLVGRVIAW